MERALKKNGSRHEIAFPELAAGLQSLGLDRSRPVIAHAALSAFGNVRGGAEAVVGALLAHFAGVMMPAFTYKTMVVPPDGPPDNGMTYGGRDDRNRLASFWTAEMPVDRLIGAVPEALRRHRRAVRSTHPILSFTGVGVKPLLDGQRLDDPLFPVASLVEAGGWVLLLGVDHSVNTSLHYAEQLAGRRSFTRWALTPDGVRTCPRFPGCSNGFVDLEMLLAPITREAVIGLAHVRALPAREMVAIAEKAFSESPRGFLCKRMDCGRCDSIRKMAHA